MVFAYSLRAIIRASNLHVEKGYNLGMVKIDCMGLTIRGGRQLATYLQSSPA